MQGQLFTQDFLTRGVTETPPWQDLKEQQFAEFGQALRGIFSTLDAASTLNEAQTESEVIHKVLLALGWGDGTLPQVNLSGKRREDVPDMLLFASSAAKASALPLKDDQRYRHGLAILEAKRWLRPLDRGDMSEATDPGHPDTHSRYALTARLLLANLSCFALDFVAREKVQGQHLNKFVAGATAGHQAHPL